MLRERRNRSPFPKILSGGFLGGMLGFLIGGPPGAIIGAGSGSMGGVVVHEAMDN